MQQSTTTIFWHAGTVGVVAAAVALLVAQVLARRGRPQALEDPLAASSSRLHCGKGGRCERSGSRRVLERVASLTETQLETSSSRRSNSGGCEPRHCASWRPPGRRTSACIAAVPPSSRTAAAAGCSATGAAPASEPSRHDRPAFGRLHRKERFFRQGDCMARGLTVRQAPGELGVATSTAFAFAIGFLDARRGTPAHHRLGSARGGRVLLAGVSEARAGLAAQGSR